MWIVKDDSPYETSYVRGVFSTIEKAKGAFPGEWRLDDPDRWVSSDLVLYRETVDEVPSDQGFSPR